MAKQKPGTTEDSGSAGRQAGFGDAESPADTGQGHYGQTGYGEGGYGKGPDADPSDDYQHSDDGLKEMLLERLHEDPAIDESHITVIVQGGVITLEGTVDSPHSRSAVENVAEQLGIRAVHNNLRVEKPDSV